MPTPESTPPAVGRSSICVNMQHVIKSHGRRALAARASPCCKTQSRPCLIVMAQNPSRPPPRRGAHHRRRSRYGRPPRPSEPELLHRCTRPRIHADDHLGPVNGRGANRTHLGEFESRWWYRPAPRISSSPPTPSSTLVPGSSRDLRMRIIDLDAQVVSGADAP